jgi:hypothetical protein
MLCTPASFGAMQLTIIMVLPPVHGVDPSMVLTFGS